MADQKPVTPSAQKPIAGAVPRPAPARTGNPGPLRPDATTANSGLLRPGTTPANPGPLRPGTTPANPGPLQPGTTPANSGPLRPGTTPANSGLLRPGATPANSPAAIPAVLRGPVAPRSAGWQAASAGAAAAGPEAGAAPTDLREAAGTVEQRDAAKPQQRHNNAGGDRPRPGTTRTGSPNPLGPGPEQRRKIARNAGSGPDKRRVHSAQGTATVPKPPAPGLLFRPIVRVADLAAAITFYEHLGAEVVHGGPEADYVLIQLGTVQVGLVAHPGGVAPGAVELNFSAALPLDELERQLRGRGVTVARTMHNTAFGPQLHVRAPDGLLIKIGQLEPDDYL